MARENFESLRLQEFNDFDIERLLKINIDAIAKENEERMKFIEDNQIEFDSETIQTFAGSVQNNAGEILHVTSILHHTDDIFSYFANGPLFREDRDS